MIKVNEINEITRIEINEIKTKTAKAKKGASPRIRISIIIFTMKKPREGRAST